MAYQGAVDAMAKQVTRCRTSAPSRYGSPRFAAIFEKVQPAWVARHGLTSDQY